MIYTGKYDNCHTKLLKTYSISKDRGIEAGYTGECFEELAPKPEFFKIWKSNKGLIPEDDNNRYYIREYYEQVLKNLDPSEVYKKINNSVLLCYEDSSEFCHRHIVAIWLEYHLNIRSFEVRIEDEKIIPEERPYYSFIRSCLEELMKDEPLVRKKEMKKNVEPKNYD